MALDHSPTVRGTRPGSSTLLDVARRVLGRLREAQAAQLELQERVMLRRQPWLEDLLHWSYDGEEWHLHGSRMPPRDVRRRTVSRSVTRSGWCPGQRHHGC
jgi:hypothetical protein